MQIMVLSLLINQNENYKARLNNLTTNSLLVKHTYNLNE